MKKKIIGAIIAIVVIALCVCVIAIPTAGNDNPLSTTISEDCIPSETILPSTTEEETSTTDTTETQSVEESEIIETQVQEIVTEPLVKSTEPVIVPTEPPVKPTEPVIVPTESPSIETIEPTKPIIIPTEPPAIETIEPEVTETTESPVIETTEPEATETPSEPEVTESEDIWAIRAAEYPEATTAWLYMKSLGWNDHVCAGIMGNIMAECGGQTLAINPYAYNSREHGGGICGWLYRYFPEVQGQGLEFQLQYLANTMEKQMGVNTTANFLLLTNCRDAALTFAKKYERCSSASYGLRQRNAETAYAYFVG